MLILQPAYRVGSHERGDGVTATSHPRVASLSLSLSFSILVGAWCLAGRGEAVVGVPGLGPRVLGPSSGVVPNGRLGRSEVAASQEVSRGIRRYRACAARVVAEGLEGLETRLSVVQRYYRVDVRLWSFSWLYRDVSLRVCIVHGQRPCPEG